MSWLKSASYSNDCWYDLHIFQKKPELKEMLHELVLAVPPVEESKLQVCELLSGSGFLTAEYLQAYPIAELTCIEQSAQRNSMCERRVAQLQKEFGMKLPKFLCQPLQCSSMSLPGSQYDLIIGSLAVHVLVGHDRDNDSLKRYEQIFRQIFNSLVPGGHAVLGDHTGVCTVFEQLQCMQKAGFAEIEVVWKKNTMFVIGGRKPENEAQQSQPVTQPTATSPILLVTPAQSTKQTSVSRDLKSDSPSVQTSPSSNSSSLLSVFSNSAVAQSLRGSPEFVELANFVAEQEDRMMKPVVSASTPKSNASSSLYYLPDGSLSAQGSIAAETLFRKFDSMRCGVLRYEQFEQVARIKHKSIPDAQATSAAVRIDEEELWDLWSGFADPVTDLGFAGLTLEGWKQLLSADWKVEEFLDQLK